MLVFALCNKIKLFYSTKFGNKLAIKMIRKYTTSDKDKILDIFKLNTPDYFDPSEIADFRKYLETNSDDYYILEHRNKIAGGVGFEINDNCKTGKITWIFFHPEYQGIGLGNTSIKHCFDIAEKKPYLEKIITTTSQLAYKFFEKYKFKTVLKEKDYWGERLDLYKMELHLNKTNQSVK